MAFTLFLETTAFLLSLISIVLVYTAIRSCKESEFIPIYYFIGLSVGGVAVVSGARALSAAGFFRTPVLVQDLFISYIALFLFGTLWQSYEAEMSIPPFTDRK